MTQLVTPTEAIEHYDRLLAERHLATTLDALDRAHSRHDMFYPDGRPWCSVLRPCIIDRTTYDQARRAAALVTRAVQLVTERALTDHALRRAIGVPQYLEPVLDLDRERGNPSLMARLDGFLEDGLLKFIEFNAEPGGMASSREVDEAFASMPIASEFGRTHPFRRLDHVEMSLEALHRDMARQGRSGAPTLVVIKVTSNIVQSRMLRWLPYAALRGCRVFVADPDQLERRDGRLRVEGMPIDYVAIVDWLAVFDPSEAMRPVLESLSAGEVRSLNGISRVVLSTSKVLFEVLTDPTHEHMFDHDLASALRQHVPWTRWVRDTRTDYRGRPVDLLSFVADQRERFVLKPSNAQGGAGLLIGAECDSAAWQTGLRIARNKPFVVQERVQPSRLSFPVRGDDGDVSQQELLWDLNPYVWNGDVADGALVRASQRSNLSAGTGSVTPLWVLD